MNNRIRPGTFLIAVGVLVVVLFSGATWATAASAPSWSTNSTTYVGIQGPQDHGKVVAINADGARQWSVSRAGSYHDVTRLENGRVLVTYASGEDDECGRYSSPCARTGIRLLEPAPADESAEIVAEWSFPVRSFEDSEIHDAEPLSGGRFLVVDMDRERVISVDPSSSDGNVRHIWNASTFYDPPADPTREDWLHMNDVDQLEDGRIMVSVRNRNQIVLLENGNVDEVINQNGNPEVIREQHNPQYLGEGAVLVADSENDRVVELHRTPTGWGPVWSASSANGVSFEWPRDADRLANGNTLITDSRNHRVVEIDKNGDVVGIRRVPALPYESDLAGVEPRGGPLLEGDVVSADGKHDLGLIGRVAAGLQHAAPLPYWFGEWHVLAALVGLAFVNAGIVTRGVDHYRN